MRIVFLDAVYLIALVNPRDQFHQMVLDATKECIGAEFTVTDAVLTEVLNYYAERGEHLRNKALFLIKSLMNRSDVNLIYHGKYLFHLGLERFEERPDKGYSLTDCISMVVIESNAITEVLTNDRHFAQAGFRVLF